MFFPIPDEFPTRADVLAVVATSGNGPIGLYVRAGAWSVHQRTDGRIPRHVAVTLGTEEEAAALVRERLWRKARNGYVFTPWPGPTRAEIDSRRADSAARQRRSRANRSHAPVTRDIDVTHTDVTGDPGPYQTKPSAAAAARARTRGATTTPPTPPPADGSRRPRAAAGGAPAVDLPVDPSALVAVDILAERTAAAGLPVRWDTLTDPEVLEVAALVTEHGDQALITAALASRAAHSTAPASARAWLPTWRALPPPGRHLAAVPETRCPEHPTELERTCRSCAADRKAGTR